MEKVRNDAAGFVVTVLIEVINANRAYLSEIDGAIGDGDHGINMSKGFSAAGERLQSQPAGLARAGRSGVPPAPTLGDAPLRDARPRPCDAERKRAQPRGVDPQPRPSPVGEGERGGCSSRPGFSCSA